ncbi:MAG: OmpH family outer membrane protein [Gammaproteobacteria bacterium]|nr:OmpH family outer membrane protein [Gammaproteobacteria bacterium]
MFKKLTLLVAFSLMAGSAWAELKIAVVNVQRAIGESDEAQALVKRLEDELQGEQTSIRALNSAISQQQEKLIKDGEVMSDAEKRKVQKEIEDKQIDYQFQVNRLQKTVNDRQQEILGQMAPKLDAVLKDLIAAEKYDLIVHRQNVLYVDAKHDITAVVTEKLNEKK